MDCSPSGSSVHGILQAEILVWVAFLSAGDFPNPGIKPSSPALQADSLLSEPLGKPDRKKSYIPLFPGLPVSRMIPSEFWVDKLNPFYSHNGNREIQVRFLQEAWFCNFFFWVKIIPLLYSKVWCESATYPQGRPPPTPRFLNYLIEFSWSVYWASHSILLLVNLKVILTIPLSQPKFPPCPLAPNFGNPVTDNGAGLMESWGPGQLSGE